ncbi:hypothetical protein [Candidatus Palauibacter sp.]|uniref:hypothetical protein n=1 Tax=Candidatus Palauibacter sp. TaxID=3101350 RepID=UPI003C7054D0
MRNVMRFALVVLCGFAGSLAAPDPVDAQNCALCKNCSNCDRSDYGSDSCDFKGDDVRLVRADDEQTLVVRLEDNVFGTWTCGEGSLRVAYREVNDGAWVEIDGAELTVLKERYPLETYVGLLNERRATYAVSPS